MTTYLPRPPEAPTLRDHFAAHAPDEIPVWFTVPKLPFEAPAVPTPPAYTLDMIADEASRRVCQQWFRDGCFELEHVFAGGVLPPDVAAWMATWQEWSDAIDARDCAHDEHRAACERARFIAWRWAYADMMIAAREEAA